MPHSSNTIFNSEEIQFIGEKKIAMTLYFALCSKLIKSSAFNVQLFDVLRVSCTFFFNVYMQYPVCNKWKPNKSFNLNFCLSIWFYIYNLKFEVFLCMKYFNLRWYLDYYMNPYKKRREHLRHFRCTSR